MGKRNSQDKDSKTNLIKHSIKQMGAIEVSKLPKRYCATCGVFLGFGERKTPEYCYDCLGFDIFCYED